MTRKKRYARTAGEDEILGDDDDFVLQQKPVRRTDAEMGSCDPDDEMDEAEDGEHTQSRRWPTLVNACLGATFIVTGILIFGAAVLNGLPPEKLAEAVGGMDAGHASSALPDARATAAKVARQRDGWRGAGGGIARRRRLTPPNRRNS